MSLLVWIIYTILLCCGPGTTDEASGKRVRTTFEQVRHIDTQLVFS